jgi:threonine/homoserine/homoserine lactone efflux protein
MFDIDNFGSFLAACILLNLTPGQDTAYIVGRTLAQGRRVGIASALGISAGSLVHTLAAAFGLSAILATSATAFLIVKILGAAYLIYLGIGLLFARAPMEGASASLDKVSATVAFQQGILTNVLNPKVALFFLAFLPQFIDPNSDSKVFGLLALGLTFITTGTLWCITLASMTSRAGRLLKSSSSAGVVVSRACGALFVALGVRLAVSKI